ncbi:MAG TPA: RNA 2',3'-cyclic phosphodiesterase [Acidimicrobiales bacterium]|nr:RNA 2',3'-cyclic phosphodiesterase [Acidimicrobiales bacterium]
MRLFVGVVPPDRVLDEIERLRRPERPGVRWTRRDQWHVTLRFLGEVADPEPVAAALDAAPLRRCEARLGPRVRPLGRQVVCLPVAGLDGLARAVEEATAGFGRPPDDRPFRGHLTLARLRRSARPSGLTGDVFEAGFPVADVRLVRSHQTDGGSRYEDLHVVPLGT